MYVIIIKSDGGLVIHYERVLTCSEELYHGMCVEEFSGSQQSVIAMHCVVVLQCEYQ